MLIDVHSIFYTIQGEGPFSGAPAVFIRLAGCNLQCPACDTEYTKGRISMRPVDIAMETARASRGNHRGLVVITGGEPFRQGIGPLIRTLISAGYYVQVETNGTLPSSADIRFHRDILAREGAYIVCSPKGSRVHKDIEVEACAYKYVLTAGNIAVDGLPTRVLDHPCKVQVARPPVGMRVYIQPADLQDPARNYANLQACIKSCMQYGYLLQLQTHKLIGVP